MVRGQHHHVSPHRLHAYAAHAAWMEDHRQLDNGALAKRALASRWLIPSRGSGKAIGSDLRLKTVVAGLRSPPLISLPPHRLNFRPVSGPKRS